MTKSAFEASVLKSTLSGIICERNVDFETAATMMGVTSSEITQFAVSFENATLYQHKTDVYYAQGINAEHPGRTLIGFYWGVA